MKIEKAIEILKADLLRPGSVDKLDFQDAEQLGIEALNCVKNNRHFGVPNSVNPLPGETKD